MAMNRRLAATLAILLALCPVVSAQGLAESHPHFHAAGHEGRYRAERFALASRLALKNVAYHPPKAGLFGF